MNYPSVQILGIRFFNGDADEAVAYISQRGGIVVVPAAPALTKLCHENEQYRRALTNADLAIADSGLMVLVWRILTSEGISRLSGLAYLRALIGDTKFRASRRTCFVLPSEEARQRTVTWSRREDRLGGEHQHYVAPFYPTLVEDRQLLALIEDNQPENVIIAIGNGPQEKLGYFLRENLSYRPAIHCIGAALGFLTGDQVAIPNWADRSYMGWFFRLIAQPRIFIPRLTRALALPWLIFRCGSELPALKS